MKTIEGYHINIECDEHGNDEDIIDSIIYIWI